MIHWIHTMVWGPGMLVLFLAVGILYTIRLRGFVFWGFPPVVEKYGREPVENFGKDREK